MAERPRRPSSELGSEPSSPTPSKKRRKSKETEEASSTEPEAVEETELTTPTTAAVSSESPETEAEPGASSKRRHEEPEEPSSSSAKRLKSSTPSPPATSTAESPVPSTSRKTEGDSVVDPLPILPPTSTAGTSTETMEVVGSGALTIQTSVLEDKYQDLRKIGGGAYGIVYRAREGVSGPVVALKKVRVPITDEGLPQSTVREIATLKELERFEHPQIVKLLDVCQGDYLTLPPGVAPSGTSRGMLLWLVFEHVERDLASFMDSCPPPGIPGETIRQMSREILLGVDFLHTHRIVHRDLKPQNLLVTSQGRIKIADFGLAKTYDFEMRLTSVVVTLWYRPPEILLGCTYATPVDIWSVGCILAELYRLKPLFPGTSEGDQLDRIFRVIGTPSQQEWPDVSLSWSAFPNRLPTPMGSIIPNLPDSGLDLIQSMLTFNPHSRLTAAQALAHRYFTAD